MSEDDRIADILADWYERQGGEEGLSPEDVIRAHPDLAEELRSHFELLEAFDLGLGDPGELPPGTPEVIGEYRILREVGRGGMGTVYEAVQTSMGRRVALKVLSPAVTSVRQAVKRFHREAQATGLLHHTNIVPVYGMGEEQGLYYYAMELVEGPTLGDAIAGMRGEDGGASRCPALLDTTNGSRRNFARSAEMMAGVAEALHAAHEKQIIHRDVKPANLLLSPDGVLKLVDFGLARLTGEGMSMTMTGQLIGTPYYMSPEQAMAKRVRVDHRSDIYSFGATLYELLTLQLPFKGDSLQEVCSQIISRDPQLPRKTNPRIPRDLETIVMKAMEKDRERRYQTAAEMAKDLRRFAEGMPIRAKRIGILGRSWRRVKRNKVRSGLAAAVVVLAVIGGLLALRSASESEGRRRAEAATARESERRREAEYDRMIARAEDAMASSMASVRLNEFSAAMLPGETARDILTRAVELDPARPEAYWIRSLAPGRTTDERVEDLSAAQARGLPAGAANLLKAYFLEISRRHEAAARVRKLAGEQGAESPMGRYARARLLAYQRRHAEAIDALTRVIDDPESGSTVRFFALAARAFQRLETLDWSGAIDDLLAVRALGDESVWIQAHIAHAWRRLEQESKAEKVFEEAVRRALESGEECIWMDICEACWTSGEWEWTRIAAEKGLKDHGKSVGLLTNLGVALLELRHLDESIRILKRALAIEPGCSLARNNLSVALLLRGDREEALDAIDQAVALDPESARQQTTRAEILYELWKYEEALEAVESAIALDSSYLRAHSIRAQVIERLGPPKAALAAYETVLGLEPEDPVALYSKGALLEKLGRKDEAHELFVRVLREKPVGHYDYRLRGVTLLRLDRYSEALDALNTCLELDPWDRMALAFKGQAYLSMGEPEKSIAAFERLMEIGPDLPARYGELGQSLLAAGRSQEAADAFRHATELLPDKATWFLNLAFTLAQRLGKTEEALGPMDQALAIARRTMEPGPELGRYHTQRGSILFRFGKLEQALEAFGEAAAMDPEGCAARAKMGAALWNLGRCEEALEAFREAVKLEPRSPEDHWDLAQAYCRLGRWKELFAAAEVCMDSMGDGPELHVWMAHAYGALGRPLDEIEAYRRAVALDPEDCSAQGNLGTALWNLGEHEEALDVYREAVKLEPRTPADNGPLVEAFFRLGRWEDLLSAARAYLDGMPGHFRVHYLRGYAAHRLGNLQEALDAYLAALECEPGSPPAELQLRISLASLLLNPPFRRYREALDHCNRIVVVDPANLYARYFRVLALRFLKRYDEAREAAGQAAHLDPMPGTEIILAHLCAISGNQEKALRVLQAYAGPWTPDCLYNRACVHALLGDADAAIQWLERAAEGGFRLPAGAAQDDPDLESLKADPRYEKLMEKLRGN